MGELGAWPRETLCASSLEILPAIVGAGLDWQMEAEVPCGPGQSHAGYPGKVSDV